MVYVTGDCHADFARFATRNFKDQEKLTRDDFVIVCGDFGIWYDNETERWWFKWLEEKNFTLLFVDGNHENFDRLYGDEFEIVDFHGGKAHKICENVYHLMRGYIFELCGKKFFAFGGASTHDIDDGILDQKDFDSMRTLLRVYNHRTKRGEMLRINHLSWWEQELPSEEEMQFGLETLKNHGNKVDYIITHCCPQHISDTFFFPKNVPDVLTEYFDKISANVEFKEWFFGHYHRSESLTDNFMVLFERFIRIV